jgi:protein required for attachment to host cells
MGARRAYARNEEIFGEGEPAEHLYQVVSGSVRCSRILADGRRQIAPPRALGTIRPAYSPALRRAIVQEIDKDLVKSPIDEVERLVASAT